MREGSRSPQRPTRQQRRSASKARVRAQLREATLDAARGIKGSSIVVAMARNGTDFGVQLAGTGDLWFISPADVPDAKRSFAVTACCVCVQALWLALEPSSLSESGSGPKWIPYIQ